MKRPAVTSSLAIRRDRIYLTGFMGCGKSTVGPILANTIGYDFLDIDVMIEAAAGTSINQIFRQHGEPYFRSLERDIVAKVSATTRTVIALGGGTVSDPGTFEIVRTTGILVYLRMTPEEIVRRLRHKTDRPMLADAAGNRLDEESLRKKIHELFSAREPLYTQADITVLTDETRVGITVDQIVKALAPYIGV